VHIQSLQGTLDESYAFVVPVAFAIGLALFLPLVWHLRREAILGWREQFGSDVGDADSVVKARADALRAMEPMGWGVIVLLMAILIVIMFVFGVVVAYGGVAVCVAGTIAIVVLIALFNVVLFAQVRLPSGAGGEAA
jgi:hypothetical protein